MFANLLAWPIAFYAIDKWLQKDSKNKDKVRTENLKAEADSIKQRLHALREMIKSKYPDYYALKNPQPVELKYLQASVLESDEVMLVYNVMDELTFLWMIGKDHFSIHQINAGVDAFNEQVAAYRDNEINIFKGHVLRGGSASDAEAEIKTINSTKLHSLLFPRNCFQQNQRLCNNLYSSDRTVVFAAV